MRKLLLSLPLLLLAASLAGYAWWTAQRDRPHYLSDLRSELVGPPAPAGHHGNLLGIRPQLYPSDYRSPAALRLKLAASLNKARDLGLLGERTVVALPDQIGTWLLLQGEKAEVYAARSLDEANLRLGLSHPWLLLGGHLQGRDLDEALLRDKATQLAQDYQQLFAGLAREYRVTLLAGSLLLPQPSLVDGRIHVGDGPLHEFGLVFDAHGQPLGEPYSAPWPEAASSSHSYQLPLADGSLEVVRSPGSGLYLTPTGSPRGLQLFLRGRLWRLPLSSIEPTPGATSHSGEGAGSQLLNLWLDPA
ncbi:hypothetical protein A9179_07470 [Pseudomonas alcaligenes]|uniref:Hydrolase n=1 Tax=Aquipseudomonas alcaligenes TaxID=43263 RepID=A0ABR7RZG4_AQUAC|nr:hydrolase [Pseudomonas alcaligenes]MBC9250109.1 hypothetical protein [Pseudomonas alcaligenes]